MAGQLTPAPRRPRQGPDDPEPRQLRPAAGRAAVPLAVPGRRRPTAGRSWCSAVGGTTDWVDGFLARRLGQVSRLGELLDPLADRLYILATLLALTIRDVLPWWFTIALLAREVVLGVLPAGAAAARVRPAAGALRRQDGHLHPAGRAARCCCSRTAAPGTHVWAYPIGWALAWWGLVLYWIAALFYVVQVGRREPSPGGAGGRRVSTTRRPASGAVRAELPARAVHRPARPGLRRRGRPARPRTDRGRRWRRGGRVRAADR